jgi:hypothetical protein
MEFGDLVFLYMDPPDTKPPLLPMFDIIDTRHRNDVVLVDKRLWDDHAKRISILIIQDALIPPPSLR